MKVESIETFSVKSRCHIVKIETDSGIVGIGESGFWGYRDAVDAVVKHIAKYLIGKDPLRIDHHWQYVYRDNRHRGGALNGALAAIDIALWDIKGKYYKAPVWQLLGGKCRDKIRVYRNVPGRSNDEMVKNVKEIIKEGYTAIKMFPFVPDAHLIDHSTLMKTTVNRVALMRETVGDDVDICIETHNRLTPSDAIMLGQKLKKYNPLHIEDPISVDSAETMAYVASKIGIPIATGERLHTIWEFKDFLHLRACSFIRPDVCLTGGITQTKKIAALAEAYQVITVPHNPLSPISTAASVQICIATPNCTLLEYKGDGAWPGEEWKQEIVKNTMKFENGFLMLPEEPGIGIELDEEGIRNNIGEPGERPWRTKLYRDGSVTEN